MKNFKFVFSPQDVQVIVNCLEEAPAKLSRGVLNKLDYQIAEQQGNLDPKPIEEGKEE